MYNFRYHLVTIVSIFAALALGLLLGVALTGSDLVRDASSNLAQSLTEQFDELNKTNDQLSDQLKTEQLLSNELLGDWQSERLKGRTIVILTPGDGDAEMASHLSNLVSQSGGIPVVVKIDTDISSKLENAALAAKLEALLPKVDNEEYVVTLGRKLAEEWSFSTTSQASTVPASFESNYHLTKQLASSGLISVTVDYGALLALEANKTATLPPAVEWQMASYRQAQSQSLPYAVNGVIDMDVHPLVPQASGMFMDPLALAITQQLDSLGQAGELPYLHAVVDAAFGEGQGYGSAAPDSDAAPDSGGGTADAPADADAPTPAPADADASADTSAGVQADADALVLDADANYFALIVQQGGFSGVLLAAARDTGLSCQISPLSSSGSYSIIALLSGGKKGSYGLDYNGISPFPPIPADPDGNRVFARGEDSQPHGSGINAANPVE